MAGCEVALLVLPVLRRYMLTDLLGIGAAGMEPAALGRIGRRRNIAFQNDTLVVSGSLGIGVVFLQNCGDERIHSLLLLQQLLRFGYLHWLKLDLFSARESLGALFLLAFAYLLLSEKSFSGFGFTKFSRPISSQYLKSSLLSRIPGF